MARDWCSKRKQRNQCKDTSQRNAAVGHEHGSHSLSLSFYHSLTQFCSLIFIKLLYLNRIHYCIIMIILYFAHNKSQSFWKRMKRKETTTTSKNYQRQTYARANARTHVHHTHTYTLILPKTVYEQSSIARTLIMQFIWGPCCKVRACVCVCVYARARSQNT